MMLVDYATTYTNTISCYYSAGRDFNDDKSYIKVAL